MRFKDIAQQNDLIKTLQSAQQYRWRGGVNAGYEICDSEGNVLFGKIWSESQAIALMTLAEMIQGKTNLEDFTNP